MKRFFKSCTVWFGFVAFLWLGGCIIATVYGWGWLQDVSRSPANQISDTTGTVTAVEAPTPAIPVSNSETVRNAGLLIAGGLAFIFAGWRAWVAERHANAARNQAEHAQRQADTAQQSLLNERYQRGGEMLGSSVRSSRMAGIYSLERLAREHPEQYHVQIMNLLCTCASDSAKIDLDPYHRESIENIPLTTLREDIQAILTIVGNRGEPTFGIENAANFVPRFNGTDLSLAVLHKANLFKASLQAVKLTVADLRECDLRGSTIRDSSLSHARLDGSMLGISSITSTNISGASLVEADLSGATLMIVNLTEAKLQQANLSGAWITGVNFSGATLEETNLSGSWLGPHTKITQNQLDQARASPSNPPNLQSVLDAETGEPLVWRGCALVEES